ncbi:MAG TPA: ABC transporter permease [Candidatus Omnitrophota bacterium]|jgi:phospholipid/cholesterol/gamma-HCH transport system permease protein|nr:MAG: putative phospholipid ABC transporter permease protein MlaE [Candidatus Omnitrophica bacterium ADurb.Bin314]HOE68071.1 ABC transporter permease [Candidatus Omnitrophota bacterium]HQB94505.1 ABC transporter permease [Candidatus Omnitrophota bacterium]
MTRWGNLKRLVSVRSWLGHFGGLCVEFFEDAGGIALLFRDTCAHLFRNRIRWKMTLDQMNKIGVMSLPLVFLTSLFTGMVLALQSAYQLRLFAAEKFTSDLIAVSLCRELGPVLTAMVVAGRVGASIAAELGTMKVTEQIDALKALAASPIQYLVIPRFVAALFMLFVLTIYADCIGMFGGYLISVFKLGMSSHTYIKRGMDALMVKDVVTGLIKAFFFGGFISIVGCFYGFRARGGAEGVGRATTLAVVVSLILVIASDALFSAIFYFF